MYYTLNEEAKIIEEFTCHACRCTVDSYAALDPCELEGELYCDSCISDLTFLRFEGFINVSGKTKKLRL